MKQGTIKSVAPKLRNGEQSFFTGQHGTTYYFMVEMEDGTKGEAGGKTPGSYRFGAGEAVEYEYTPSADERYPGKLKIQKVGGFQGGGRASGGVGFAKNLGSPARFLLAAIITAGVKQPHWEDALRAAMETLAKVDKPTEPTPAPASNGRPTVALGPAGEGAFDDQDEPF